MDDLAPDEGDLDVWASELRDDILKQVHQALDMYEDAAQERIAAVLMQESDRRRKESSRPTDMAQRHVDTEGRLAVLEARGGSAPLAGDSAIGARLSALEARHGPQEARLAALEARLNGNSAREERGSSRADSELSFSPQPMQELVTASDLTITKAKIAKGLLALEEGMMNLQGELAFLHGRMQMQGLSSTIFSLRSFDMDERSRAKVLDVVVSKEAEVKRQLDAMQDAKDKGNTAELVTEYRVRIVNAPRDPADSMQPAVRSRERSTERLNSRSPISAHPGGRNVASPSPRGELRAGHSEAANGSSSRARSESVAHI